MTPPTTPTDGLSVDWRTDPRVAPILESIAQHPPVCETRFDTYVTTRDEWREYVGYRVDRLSAIHTGHMARHLAYATATDDWSAWDAFMAVPGVQAVVEAAVERPDLPLNRSGLSMLAAMPEAA